MHDIPSLAYRASSVKHQPRSNRYYFDVGIGSVCLSGADTGGAYCLLEVGLAPGMSVPRHTHTREDEAYFVLIGELEVTVASEIFILRPGDSLMAPRDVPHQLRNSGDIENHYLLVFSPSGFEEFLRVTAVPAPDNAAAPAKPPAIPVQNVHKLATEFGIHFDDDGTKGVRMPARDDALRDRLSRYREIKITVTGRNSGRAISIPVWFVLDYENLYLLPVHGSETQWYKNVVKNPSIRINAWGAEVEFNVAPVTDPTQVSSIIQKFRAKYGANDVDKYYSKLDVAVLAQAR